MAEVLFYFSLIRLLSMPVTMTTAKVMSKESVALSKVGLSRWLFVKFRHQLGWQRTLERMVAMMMFICVVFNRDFQFFSMLIFSCFQCWYGHMVIRFPWYFMESQRFIPFPWYLGTFQRFTTFPICKQRRPPLNYYFWWFLCKTDWFHKKGRQMVQRLRNLW